MKTTQKLVSAARYLALALFAIYISGCATQNSGDSSATTTQIDVAQQAHNAMQTMNWPAYAALVKPEGLDRFRGALMPGIERLIIAAPADSINLFGKFYNAQQIQNENPEQFFCDMMALVVELSPDLKNTFSQMTNSNIGAVAENDSTVHVVTRTSMTIGGREVSEMNVNSVVKSGDEWKLELSPKIEGIALMMSQGLPQ